VHSGVLWRGGGLKVE